MVLLQNTQPPTLAAQKGACLCRACMRGLLTKQLEVHPSQLLQARLLSTSELDELLSLRAPA